MISVLMGLGKTGSSVIYLYSNTFRISALLRLITAIRPSMASPSVVNAYAALVSILCALVSRPWIQQEPLSFHITLLLDTISAVVDDIPDEQRPTNIPLPPNHLGAHLAFILSIRPPTNADGWLQLVLSAQATGHSNHTTISSASNHGLTSGD